MLFQKQLGTLKEKSERISALSAFIASQIDANETQAARAGLLAKTDLMSNMVMEFPDVQGVMGKYYALNDGEDAPVAEALYEQYMPRFAGDALPSSGFLVLASYLRVIKTHLRFVVQLSVYYVLSLSCHCR